MYKDYLFILDDFYSLKELKKYIGVGKISEKAYLNSFNILNIKINNVNLNDKYNETIVKYGKNTRIDIGNPVTLFAPYCMTYDPDIFQENRIGWPIQDMNIQNKGYEAVQQQKPSCIVFFQKNFIRMSPYTSHCSAYVAWITQTIFGVSLTPTQIGDWCHAAAEQRDIMIHLSEWWEKVDAIQAQSAANDGKLAIAAHKVDNPDKEDYKQNGHIAIILPMTWQMAKYLQNFPNYPKNPVVNDENSFKEFIKIYGPEITQSGGLNFSHTICANGFANYYNNPGETPIDNFIDFFTYKFYTQSSE